MGAFRPLSGLESFNLFAKQRNLLYLTVYSDGSRDEAGDFGAGYGIYRGPLEIIGQKVPLGQTVEIFDAEVIRALEGLQAACYHLISHYATNVVVSSFP